MGLTESKNNFVGLNALALASSKIIIPDNELKNKFESAKLSKSLKFSSSGDINASKDILNKILNYTQLKRACCLYYKEKDKNEGEKSIGVKIPIPGKNADGTPLEVTDEMMKKYKYYEVNVKIPVNDKICNNIDGDNIPYTRGSSKCDDFYKVYSENVIYDFYLLNPDLQFKADSMNYDALSSYGSDTICYAPLPQWASLSKLNTSPICVVPNCGSNGVSQNNIYLDPTSREKPACNICLQQLIADDVTATNINIQNKLTQQCAGSGDTTGTQGSGNSTNATTRPGSNTNTTTPNNTNTTPNNTNTTTPNNTNTTAPQNIISSLSNGTKIGLGVTSSVLCFCILIIFLFLLMRRR